MKARLWIKIALCRLHLAAGLIEFCKDCGVRQPLVWSTSDALWAEIRDRDLAQDGGVLCPKCFDHRADAKGILLMWEARIDSRSVPPKSS